jgi:tetratricopeptide (TPR) repeat protein
LRASEDAAAYDWAKEIRKERDDVDLHANSRSSDGRPRRPAHLTVGRSAGTAPFDRGIVEMECGRLAPAIEFFSEAVERGDRPALAMSKRGVCKLRCGDRTGAARDFAAALERDPKCVPALVNLGNLALEANMLDEARRRYDAAIKIDDRSAAAHHNLGVVYRRIGRLADSVRELRLAAVLESQPNKIVERFKLLWRKR